MTLAGLHCIPARHLPRMGVGNQFQPTASTVGCQVVPVVKPATATPDRAAAPAASPRSRPQPSRAAPPTPRRARPTPSHAAGRAHGQPVAQLGDDPTRHGEHAARCEPRSGRACSSDMGQTCDGCGKTAMRMFYRADGPWAGRWICRDCGSGRTKMTRLSSLVAFKFRLAQVLPIDDKATPPILRLMMAVDDVRRAQIRLIEAAERLDGVGTDKYVAVGDWLYFLRLLFSHIHEARRALTGLDFEVEGRAD